MTRIILAAEAGSLFDIAGRAFTEALGRALDERFSLDNVGESSGNEGAEAAARAPKDGKTLLVCSKGGITSHPHRARTYSPGDFAPVCQFAEAPIGIAVGRDSRFGTLAELFSAARAMPERITFSTPNPFHTQRLALAGFELSHGIRFKFVAVQGGNAGAVKQAAAGSLDFALLAVHNYVEPLRAGQIRVLGLAHPERLAFLPEVPTCLEQGFDLVAAIWLGLLTPAGVAEARLRQLRAAVRDAEGKARGPIARLRLVPSFLDHAAFAEKIAADSALHRDRLAALGAL